MELQQALKIQEELSENYLFANIGKKQLAYAGVDDPDERYYNYKLFENFQIINAISVLKDKMGGYILQMYHTEHMFYPSAIAEHYGLSGNETSYWKVEPFSFQNPRYRPLQIGCSVGHRDMESHGTLGCFVKDKSGDVFLLSNYHVLYNPDSDYGNDFIIQPGKPLGGKSEDSVGLLAKKAPYSDLESNYFDAALAGPVSVGYTTEIPCANPSCSLAGITEPKEQKRVYKCGSATGRTQGKIHSFLTNVKVLVNGQEVGFRNQIAIQGMNKDFSGMALFSAAGDSGSLVINQDDNQAVGLLFAGSDSGISLANPLPALLKILDVELVF